jgi:chromosome partitioning protein
MVMRLCGIAQIHNQTYNSILFGYIVGVQVVTGKVVGVLNIKGGVGKSTLAIHMASALTKYGKVMLVDADSQGTSRDWNQIGGHPELSVVAMDRESIDRDIEPFLEAFDWVVIDGPVKMEKINAAAIKASDLVVIPVQPSQADLWATDSLVELIKARQSVTDGIPAAAFQINRAKKGTKLANEVRSTVEQWGLAVLDGIIHDRTAFTTAIGQGKTVGGQTVGDGTVIKDEYAETEISRMVKQIVKAFGDEG